MNIVECEQVKKTYQQGKMEVPALRGIDLVVEKGAFITLAGPSGSGKTTLLNMIGGLDRVSAGRVTLDGEPLSELKDSQLAEIRLQKIGFVFQAYNLIPVLTALENVEFVMLLQGVSGRARRQRAEELLREVDLGDMLQRRPPELSGGQQQRVAVARAIAADPRIVLADEPTANLDSSTGKDLLTLMRKMNQEKNVTFIFSTHDKMVMDFADRKVVIRDGRIGK